MREDYRNQSGYFSPTENAVVHHWDSSNGFNLKEEKIEKKFNPQAYIDRLKGFTKGQLISEDLNLRERKREMGMWLHANPTGNRDGNRDKYYSYQKEIGIIKEKLRLIHEYAAEFDKKDSKKKRRFIYEEMKKKIRELLTKEDADKYFEELHDKVQSIFGEEMHDALGRANKEAKDAREANQ